MAASGVYFGLLSQKGRVVTKKETEEIKHLFGVVAEDLRSDIRQVAEGVGLLNERFDGLEGRFDGLEGKFDGLEGKFEGFQGQFHGLLGRFDGLEQKVDRMGRDLTAEIRQVGAAVGDLRVRVERLESAHD